MGVWRRVAVVLVSLVSVIAVRDVPAQTLVTERLTIADFAAAASTGRTFALVKKSSLGTECGSGAGGANPVATSAWADSKEAPFQQAKCEHRGFHGNGLANGWKVKNVQLVGECRERSGTTWKYLNPDQCSFIITKQPAVGTADLDFTATFLVNGRPTDRRQAKITWNIDVEGPQGIDKWTPAPPAAPVALLPADGFSMADLPQEQTVSFAWTGPVPPATEYHLYFCNTDRCHRVYVGTASGMEIPVSARAGPTFYFTFPNRVRVSSNFNLTDWSTIAEWYVVACVPGVCSAQSERRRILYWHPS